MRSDTLNTPKRAGRQQRNDFEFMRGHSPLLCEREHNQYVSLAGSNYSSVLKQSDLTDKMPSQVCLCERCVL